MQGDTLINLDGTNDILTDIKNTTEKSVGFDENSDTTISIVTVGSVKTITETDGVKTLTVVINKTDLNNISITSTWT